MPNDTAAQEARTAADLNDLTLTGRRWIVWAEDDVATRALTATEAAHEFLSRVAGGADESVEIRQCGEDELEFEDIDPYDLTTHDLCDGAGNLALPVADAKLWNEKRPGLGWACPKSLHVEPKADEDDGDHIDGDEGADDEVSL